MSSFARAARPGIVATLAILVPFLMALAFSAPADAASKKKQKRKGVLVELRVEGPDGALDPGTWYVAGPGRERVRRSRPSDACKRGKGTIPVPGASPIGLAQAASKFNRALRLVRAREDEAGIFTCEIGDVLGRPFTDPNGFAGWSYYVNGVFGLAAADQVALRRGDRVLWLFSDFGLESINTGPRLELRRVPAGTTETTFTVRVIEHDYEGGKGPAEGVSIDGAQQVTELGNGEYEVEVERGFSELRASRGEAVPSAPVTVCSRVERERCPQAHGRTIYGSAAGERLKGTRGWDRIKAGGGADRIDLRAGGRDRVNCGGGKDVVLLARGDRDDRIARNCERVIRRR